MDSIQAQASRDTPKESVLARLINEGKKSSVERGDLNKPVEDFFRDLQTQSRILQLGERMDGLHIGQREDTFIQCASVLYAIRMILPTHPDYQTFTAVPLVRTKVDTVSQFCGPSNASLHPPLYHPPSQSMENHAVIPSILLSTLKLSTYSIRTGFQ